MTGLGIKLPNGSDIARLDALRGVHSESPALLFGNGWRLAHMRTWAANDGVVTIGTNRSWEIVESAYMVAIDQAGEAPASYQGIRFGAAREGRFPGTLGAYWSEYWNANGRLLDVNPNLTGLYAIEVAVFLGCAPIYLVGFDGDNRPQTEEGHFYAGKKAAQSLDLKQNAWLSKVLMTGRVEIISLTFGDGEPKVNAVSRFLPAESSGVVTRRKV